LHRPLFTGEGVFLERCSAYMQALAPNVTHDLLVTHVPCPPQTPPICSTLGAIFYLCRGQVSERRRQLALFWWFAIHLHRYETVHFHVHVDWYFAAVTLAKLMRRRVIVSATLDDSVPVLISRYRPSLRSLARRSFQWFDGYVSISPKLQGETASVMDAAKCHLIPCGIDCPPVDRAHRRTVREALGIPIDALVLIFVGGLCQRKDPLLLVRQLPTLLQNRPDVYLMLIGPDLEPEYVTEMRAFIRAHDIERHVVFVGEVQNPHPYFDAADIMTFASHLEGLGTVVPEAMAHALPVVVRHLPGVNDFFVRDGENGYFFTDDAGYVRGLRQLMHDAPMRRRLGDNAQQLVRAKFDMEKAARRYLEIYGFPVAPSPAVNAPVTVPAELGATASIINRRMQSPVAIARLEHPYLLTFVDAEEEFDWNVQFSRSSTSVGSMMCQEPAQRILEKFGAVPTYLVDYPVVTQDSGRAPLREMLQDGRCDIGTQLHAWVTPPFREQVNNRNSYAGNLPVSLEFEKIQCLTSTIEDALGMRPRIYRAGRYGAGPRTADILKHLGYLADTSVMPAWDFTAQEGMDFTQFSAQPTWLNEARDLLEIPAASEVVGWMRGLPDGFRRAVFAPASDHLGVPSLTARLGLLERIKLSPEGITPSEAKRLIRHMLAGGHRVFVLTYHTPSLVPGNTPYVRNKADLDRFLAWLEEIYGFFTQEVGGRCANWRDLYDTLYDGPNSPPVARSPRPVPVLEAAQVAASASSSSS
jgi:glycosyltransferase involved in cell wall biosynthesis